MLLLLLFLGVLSTFVLNGRCSSFYLLIVSLTYLPLKGWRHPWEGHEDHSSGHGHGHEHEVIHCPLLLH